MKLKDIIRNTTDTQPFNKFEIAVLREIHRTLGGTVNAQRLNDIAVLLNSKIMENLALDGDILMYFYSLYRKNLGKDNTDDDFNNIKNVDVPKMKEYEVTFIQDVSSWRKVTNKVAAEDGNLAMDAMDADYDYASMINPTITNHIDSAIEQGDYNDIFDTHSNVLRDLNESIKKRKIIITESQLSKIEEDLKYWNVSDVNPMDFDARTVRAFQQRDFGNINAYNVPKDEERMDTQMSMRRDDGMNEPVIILQNPDGTYQLIEGWHRTMSILKMGDKPTEDYYDEDDYNDELWDEETPTELKDWDKVKLRAFVAPNPDFKEKK